MIDAPTGEGSPEERKAHLESSILRLKEADFSYTYDKSYNFALSNQAVPFIDFLSQIKDEVIDRKNQPILASFRSQSLSMHGEYYQQPTNRWDSYLRGVILDLVRAADIKILFPQDSEPGIGYVADNSKWQMPENFKVMFDHLQLPPALRAKIEPRKDQIVAELDESIKNRKERNEELNKLLNPSFARVLRDLPHVLPGISNLLDYLETRRERKNLTRNTPATPDYRLKIDHHPIYEGHVHNISLAPPEAPMIKT